MIGDEARPRKRLYYIPVTAAMVAALVLILVAIARGWHPEHWWPVAGFLAVAAGGTTTTIVVNRLTRRRAQRFRHGVPRDVLLRGPRGLDNAAFFVSVGAAVGAIAAAIGLPGVGLGLALALTAFISFGLAARLGRGPPPHDADRGHRAGEEGDAAGIGAQLAPGDTGPTFLP